MCGLIFVKKQSGRARKAVLKKYERQRTRGVNGFGFVAMKQGKIVAIERAATEGEIKRKLRKQGDADTIMFHHRQPTSTPNVPEAAHPIFVHNDKLKHDYYFIHNGIIYNDDELKEKHNKAGFIYTTEMQNQVVTRERTYDEKVIWNDSESLAIELALAIEGAKVTIEARGSIAFIALQARKGHKEVQSIFFGRNFSNPLIVEKEKYGFSLVSEAPKEDSTDVKPHKLFRYSLPTWELFESDLVYPPTTTTTHYGSGYGYRGGEYGYYGGTEEDDEAYPHTKAWKDSINKTLTLGAGEKTTQTETSKGDITRTQLDQNLNPYPEEDEGQPPYTLAEAESDNKSVGDVIREKTFEEAEEIIAGLEEDKRIWQEDMLDALDTGDEAKEVEARFEIQKINAELSAYLNPYDISDQQRKILGI